MWCLLPIFLSYYFYAFVIDFKMTTVFITRMQKNQQRDIIIMGLIFVSGEKSCRCKESYGKKVNIFYFKIVRNSQMCFLVFGKAYFKKNQRKVHHVSHPDYWEAENANEHLVQWECNSNHTYFNNFKNFFKHYSMWHDMFLTILSVIDVFQNIMNTSDLIPPFSLYHKCIYTCIFQILHIIACNLEIHWS